MLVLSSSNWMQPTPHFFYGNLHFPFPIKKNKKKLISDFSPFLLTNGKKTLMIKFTLIQVKVIFPLLLIVFCLFIFLLITKWLPYSRHCSEPSKLWVNDKFFFYMPCHFYKWVIMVLQDFQSLMALKHCLTPYSLFLTCHPFIQAY